MARGTTLAALLSSLKYELSQNNAATAQDSELKNLLSNKQKWLATEYDWPFLEQRWDVATAVSNRYLPFPTTTITGLTNHNINFERPVKVEVFYNNLWQPVNYGIDSQEYNYINSDQGRTLDPIQKWRFNDENAFEIWPMPASSGQTVRFTGQRALAAFIADADVCDLDDQMIMLFVLAERLKRLNRADADEKLTMATERMRQVRGSYPVRNTFVTMGGGYNDDQIRIGVASLVVVHG